MPIEDGIKLTESASEHAKIFQKGETPLISDCIESVQMEVANEIVDVVNVNHVDLRGGEKYDHEV